MRKGVILNILLVDDDINVLESLQRGIDYNKLGIDKVYAADTAMEAKEILKNIPINIMITDIEMPQESGIELLKWTKENNMHIVTIFCTCYADFNYAKKALELQCFAYYLKPISFGEFEKIIREATEKVIQDSENKKYYLYGEYWLDDQKNRKENFWKNTLFNIFDQDKELLQASIKHKKLDYYMDHRFRLFLISIKSMNGAYRSLTKTMSEFIVKNIIEEIFQKNNHVLEAVTKYEDNVFVIVTKSNQENADITSVIEELINEFTIHLKCQVTVFYDKECKLLMIRKSIEKLLYIWNENVNNNLKYIYAGTYKKIETEYSFAPTNNWEIYLDCGAIQNVIEEIDRYLSEKRNKNILYTSELKSLQMDLLQMIHATLLKNNIEAHELFVNSEYDGYKDNSLKSYDNYIKFCKYVLEKAYGYISFVKKSNSVVDTIKQYIKQHYSEEITRNDLAKTVYLNSDYMSRIFRKEEGMSITDYVMDVRIKKAAELLAYTDKPINETAIEIGYDNFSYFSRLFKKRLGYSPKEYRKIKREKTNEQSI